MSNDLRGAVCLAIMGKIRVVLGRLMVSDQAGNVLLNVFMPSLGFMSYIPTIAVAHKLINNIIVMMGR